MNFNHVRGVEDSVAKGSWLEKRTIMEKRLLMATAVIGCVMVALLAALLIMHTDSTDTCISPVCVTSATDILNYVDESHNPCDDFYQFVCGNFDKDANLADDESTDMKAKMDAILTNRIRHMIEDPSRKADDAPAFSKTKRFYRGCMNESGHDSKSLNVTREILRDVGGWPALDAKWKEGDFDWRHATNKLGKIGYTFDLFLSVDVAVNEVNEENHIIEINPPKSKRLEIKDRYRDLHLAYLTDIAVMAGAPKNRAEREAKDVMEFQEGLRKVAKRSEERVKDNYSYNPKTILDLHDEIPNFPWFDYINRLLYPNAKISSDEVINVSDIHYIKELLSLMRRADKRVQANFISWHFIQNLIEYLPKQFRDRLHEYLSMTERHGRKARWEICLGNVEDVMPFTLKELYVQKFATDEIKAGVREITNNVKRRYDKYIDMYDWLDEQGKQFAKEKIASVVDYVADYGEGHDDKTIDDVYDEVTMDEDNFIVSLLKLQKARKNLYYRKLHEPVKHEHEERDKIYSRKENSLTIPIDFLHGIYFDVNRPKYMNYGAIGSIIAAELSDMFLDGRYFDVHGNTKDSSTSESMLDYQERVECFQKQRTGLFLPKIGKTVNVSLSRSEDLAHLAGKKIAYDAYASWIANNEMEPTLPGVSYSQKQLFWISSALYECSRDASRDLEKLLRENKRTPTKFKINGALRNLRVFAEDFACPSTARMNPAEKCEMW